MSPAIYFVTAAATAASRSSHFQFRVSSTESTSFFYDLDFGPQQPNIRSHVFSFSWNFTFMYDVYKFLPPHHKTQMQLFSSNLGYYNTPPSLLASYVEPPLQKTLGNACLARCSENETKNSSSHTPSMVYKGYLYKEHPVGGMWLFGTF